MDTDPPLVIVDAANVVGSVPDGWWRDRVGATERLRDSLVPLAESGIPRAGVPGPAELVLVVEGVARGVASVPCGNGSPGSAPRWSAPAWCVRRSCPRYGRN